MFSIIIFSREGGSALDGNVITKIPINSANEVTSHLARSLAIAASSRNFSSYLFTFRTLRFNDFRLLAQCRRDSPMCARRNPIHIPRFPRSFPQKETAMAVDFLGRCSAVRPAANEGTVI